MYRIRQLNLIDIIIQVLVTLSEVIHIINHFFYTIFGYFNIFDHKYSNVHTVYSGLQANTWSYLLFIIIIIFYNLLLLLLLLLLLFINQLINF